MRRSSFMILLLMLVLLPRVAAGQEATYTLAFRGVPLDRALERFVEATGVAVAYDPALANGHHAFCVTEDAVAEQVLRCLLDDSGLDYYRLSSGTYVLATAAAARPIRGHLAGTVTDGTTGSPLPGAHVYLADAGVGTVTNDAGYFVLADLLPGYYDVQVSYMGYATWQDTIYVEPAARTRARASLQPQAVVVTPVVVDGVHQRLASEALGRTAAQGAHGASWFGGVPVGLHATSASLPGVRQSDVLAGVHVQGGDLGDHELRLDGVPVYQPRLPGGVAGPFAALALERLTVEKAGFDATLGSHTSAVLRAEHALGGRSTADVRVDPLALDARVQMAGSDDDGREIAAMAAGRVGLWDLYASPSIHRALSEWSRPDPFLLTASVAPGDAAETLERQFGGDDVLPERAMHFTDLHGAVRVRHRPLHTFYVSSYYGRRQLAGAHGLGARSGFGADAQAPLFTTNDDYGWRNALAQIRYDAVLGDRTVAEVQLRGSHYALDHTYAVLDSFAVASPDMSRTTPVQDGNSVGTVALEGMMDHAREWHHLRLGLEAILTRSAFDLYGVRFAELRSEVGGPAADPSRYAAFDLAGPLRSVRHEFTGWRLAAYGSDRWRIAERTRLEGSLRLTYLPARRTVYAEPRMALRFDGTSAVGSWSTRTAAGVYRQYVNRFDASVLDVGALLPTTQVWLPVDASVRPPLAYHLAQDVLLQPTERLDVRLEGYVKYQPHQLLLRYATASERSLEGLARRQTQFLTAGDGYALGGVLAATWRSDQLHVDAHYERSHAVRRSRHLFGGEVVPVPWNEPHRIVAEIDWSPTSHLTVLGRARSVWGRTWGFRRAYYDYFGHDPTTRLHAPYDLGHPVRHKLPPLHEVDLGLAYRLDVGDAGVQAHLDVRNVLDRRNVLDWRLDAEDGSFRRIPRYGLGRMPVLAVRLTL